MSEPKLRNYRYRWVPRRNGSPRVIEMPKARLKEIQRWVLREILDHVPAHDGAHGFTRGRSVVTHAALHTGQDLVLRFDLADFFASIAAARVFGIFRTVGYAPAVAHVLTGLSTNAVPLAVWQDIPRAAAPNLLRPRFWLGRSGLPRTYRKVHRPRRRSPISPPSGSIGGSPASPRRWGCATHGMPTTSRSPGRHGCRFSGSRSRWRRSRARKDSR